jgi:hypothetical protein
MYKTTPEQKIMILPKLVLALFITVGATAQERLKPGAIYEQGEEIFAPVVGFKGIIPQGWFGTLPQEEEVFLLIPVGNAEGYMFINANPTDLSQLMQSWSNPFSLTDDLVITLSGKPLIEGNRMTGDFVVTGSQKPYAAHVVATDGGFGWTISIALLCPEESFSKFKTNFDQLVANSKIEKPSLGSRYDDFDWPEFLKGKYLTSYISAAHYQQQDELWLCPSGDFRSKIKSKGRLVVEKSPYNGKRKGTWSASGTGTQGVLNLTTAKGEAVSLDMEIKDDKIFINGGRFFALQHNDCK